MATTQNSTPPQEFDAVVVGAGFSGLYAVWRLRADGLSVKAYDAGTDVGGVWDRNRYPGAQTDTPQEAYQYSFDKDVLNDWSYSRRFPPQHQVLGYLGYIADRFDLRAHYSFCTKVERAHFDSATGRWIIATDSGSVVSAKYFVTALGVLSEPVRPNIPGAETFQGEVLFTNNWPRHDVDLRSKRIALIGTGSSGVQITPHLAEAAAQLTVYQRTPNYVVPTGNRELTDADHRELRDEYDDVRRRVRGHPAGFPFERRIGRRAVDTPDQERARIFEESWIRGGFSFLYEGFDDLEEIDEANDMAADFIRSKIADIVKDEATAAALSPTYHYGLKRPPTGDGYYQAFNNPHVNLIDLKSTPIEAITPTGIKTSTGEQHFDIIVFATGFEVGVGPYHRIDIRGRDGRTLSEHWADGPSTYLGVAVVGFPNMFMIYGPHTPFANVPPGAEYVGNWVANLIDYMRSNRIDLVEPTPQAEHEWDEHVVDAAGERFISQAVQANSWLVGANLENSKPSVVVYLGGHDVYADKLDEQAIHGYPAFDQQQLKG